MRISDWSSDVCSSDLIGGARGKLPQVADWGRDDVETGSQGGILIHKRQSYMAQPHSNGQWLSVRTMAEIGRASCRERVCQYVSISVVAVSFKQTSYIYTSRSHIAG